MHVRRLESWNEAAKLCGAWNDLAGSVPFLQWEWLGVWWKHYGAGMRWFVLSIHDDDGRLAGIAPWLIKASPVFGRVIRFLGSGQSCSDYLTVLCRPQDHERVSSCLANWLLAANCRAGLDGWDLLHLDGVVACDPFISRLLVKLDLGGCTIHTRDPIHTWRIALPPAWEDYLRQLSKPNRRHARALQQRLVDPGLVSVRVVSSDAELERVWPVLVDLHQRRRRELGQPGCFANPAFAGFAREAAERFLEKGQLELLWIERGGVPLGAQLAFLGGGVTYAYQTGIESSMLADSPGWLVHTESIKRAMHLGHTAFDFLRGDESHKHRMGAEPRAMLTARVVPPRLGPKIRHSAWLAGDTVKKWIKSGLNYTGMAKMIANSTGRRRFTTPTARAMS